MAFKKLKLWFNRELAIMLSQNILKELPSFDDSAFVRSTASQLDSLELKARVEVFADELYVHLNNDYELAIKILLKVLGPENERETGMFKEYYWIMPIAKMVEKYGQCHFKLSMVALEEITKRNTSEYAIRPFLISNYSATMRQMTKWSKSPNSHVRRLSSEGVRPRLPWASKLQMFIDDPKPIIPILKNLKQDNSRYVQKSVANCINDILKDNLETGQNLIEEWMATIKSKETDWIIIHSIRNLIKKEDKWAIDIKKLIDTNSS